jgi:protein-disulfide isomerase
VPLIEQVLEKNPKSVKVVFKNMPLGMHKMAQSAAKAALAAHEQGKFWDFHDQLFAQKSLTKDSLSQIAVALGLDTAKFDKDMASPKIMAQLQKDLRDAQKAGVTGTPSVFINGRVPKQRSLRGFQAIIDDELRKKGAN